MRTHVAIRVTVPVLRSRKINRVHQTSSRATQQDHSRNTMKSNKSKTLPTAPSRSPGKWRRPQVTADEKLPTPLVFSHALSEPDYHLLEHYIKLSASELKRVHRHHRSSEQKVVEATRRSRKNSAK